MENKDNYNEIKEEKPIIRRDGITIFNDFLTGSLGITGLFTAVNRCYEFFQNISQTPYIQKTGEILQKIIEYGPTALVFAAGVYGTVLAVKGVDKLSLENQMKREKKSLEKALKQIEKNEKQIEELNKEYEEDTTELQDDYNKDMESLKKGKEKWEEKAKYFTANPLIIENYLNKSRV